MSNYSSAAKWAEMLVDRAEKKILLGVLKKAGAYIDKQCSYPKNMGLVRFIEKNETEWLR